MGINLDSLAAAYLRRKKKDRTHFRAFLKVDELLKSDPEQAWQLALRAIARSRNDYDLGYVAAGVLEDLLKTHGMEFIERVEEQARLDPKFQHALSGVWINESYQVFSRWFELLKKYGYMTGLRQRL